MTLEEKVFLKQRFDRARMKRFGFRDEGENAVFEADFFDGDFHAVITVDQLDHVHGDVIDKLNGEPYAPLRAERFQGNYVTAVREAYEDLLKEIVAGCCDALLFESSQARRIAELIRERWGVEPDFPWEKDPYDSAAVFRHLDSEKWFGLIMHVARRCLTKDDDEEKIDVMNLKIDPAAGEMLCQRDGIYPAYHMHHRLWISVALDDTLSDEKVMALIEDSFRLTDKKPKRKKMK